MSTKQNSGSTSDQGGVAPSAITEHTPGTDPPAKRMLKLYHGNEQRSGRTRAQAASGSGKVESKSWLAEEPLTADIWREHLEGKLGCGAIPIFEHRYVVFGAIDVDDYSIEPDEMVALLKEHDLPLVPIRSKSGGWHLTLFVDEPVHAALVRLLLNAYAAKLGLGGSEVFPKQSELTGDNKGSYINGPYFGRDARVAYGRDAKPVGLEAFFEMAEAAKVTKTFVRERSGLTASTKARAATKEEPKPPYVYPAEPVVEGGRDNALIAHVGWLRRTGYEDDELKERAKWFNDNMLVPPLAVGVVEEKARRALRKPVGFGSPRARIIPAVRACDESLSGLLEPEVLDEIMDLWKPQIRKHVEQPLRERLGKKFPATRFKEAIYQEWAVRRSGSPTWYVMDGHMYRLDLKDGRLVKEFPFVVEVLGAVKHEGVFGADARIDDGSEVFELKVTVPDGTSRKMRATRAEIPKFSEMSPGLGTAFNYPPGKGQLLREAVFALAPNLLPIVEYGYTGWVTVDGEPRYLHHGGSIGAEGNDPDVLVRLGEGAEYQRLRLPDPEDDPAIAREMLERVFGSDPSEIAIASFALGAVLMYMEPTLYLYGPTGAGKSSRQAAYGLSWFVAGGKVSHRDPLFRSANSTGLSLQQLQHAHKNTVLCVDDFALQESRRKGEEQASTLDTLVRGSANHTGRSRMTRDIHVREAPKPQCALIVTGEFAPTQGTSLLPRTFSIEIRGDGEGLGTRLRERSDAFTRGGLPARVMAGFVRWIAQHGGPEAFVGRRAELRDAWDGGTDLAGHARTRDNAASVEFGLAVLLDYALDSRAIDKDSHEGYLARLHDVVHGLAVVHDGQVLEERPTARFVCNLREAFDSGQAHLLTPDNAKLVHDPGSWGYHDVSRSSSVDNGKDAVPDTAYVDGPLWVFGGSSKKVGWLDEATGEVLLLPGPAFEAAGGKAKLGVTQNELYRQLAEDGITEHAYVYPRDIVEREEGDPTGRRLVGIAAAKL